MRILGLVFKNTYQIKLSFNATKGQTIEERDITKNIWCTLYTCKTISTVREWTVVPLQWILCARAFCITHVISILTASQLHFLANNNAELARGSQ